MRSLKQLVKAVLESEVGLACSDQGLVAIKVIQKTNQSLSKCQGAVSEVDSLRTVNHPNIVNLLEVIDTEETLFIVMSTSTGRLENLLGGQRLHDGGEA